jgi:iron(III) transport system substrate-binding protein
LVLLSLAAAQAAPLDAKRPATQPEVVAAAAKEGKLLLYSTTEATAMAPLLRDFTALHPQIAVEFSKMNSTEIYDRFVSEAAAGGPSADFLWSSAMDLQMKLANDGYALEYTSPEVSQLPPWAVWKNQAFGTTFEPIVFVYNRWLLKSEEVPRTHAELTKLLKANPGRFKGKVTAYDPERSGLGFMLLTQDSQIDPAFVEAAKTYGSVGIKLYPNTGVMLEHIESGEQIIGFNMIGSYAILKQRPRPLAGAEREDSALGIVYPKDYTLVMSRIAIIPKAAKHPAAAKVFLDYLLSARGQEIIANRAALFSIRRGVRGETTDAALEKELGASLKPIAVSPSLLIYLDPAKRLEFLKQWQKALGTK